MHRVPAGELVTWYAFYQLEPWGSERDDYRAALTASVMLNMNKRPGAKDLNPHDFYPRPVVPQTPDEQIALMRRMAANHG